MISKCFVCERADEETKLYKCPICFKWTCDEHAYRRSGREFCTSGCAQYFFFGDEED